MIKQLFSKKTYSPLVSDTELEKIFHSASKNPSTLQNPDDVEHILLGEQLSKFPGSGYEFADNTRYMPGDDRRFINWRLYARTGELYRKSFYEERRPQVWLILDRRSSMRFGTRIHLKAALAAQLAIYQLYSAHNLQLLTGSVLIDENLEWIQPARGNVALTNMINKLRAPCPPLRYDNDTDTFTPILSHLLARLPTGCIIVFYSDFSSMQERDRSLIHALRNKHHIIAQHIIDRSEAILPPGRYSISNYADTMSVDDQNPALRDQLNQVMQKRLTEIKTWFENAGCRYQRYFADFELLH